MIELRRRYNKVADAPSYSRLPKGYQEVEYLQNDSGGNCYIDLGFPITYPSIVKLNTWVSPVYNTGAICGQDDYQRSLIFGENIYSGGTIVYWNIGGAVGTSFEGGSVFLEGETNILWEYNSYTREVKINEKTNVVNNPYPPTANMFIGKGSKEATGYPNAKFSNFSVTDDAGQYLCNLIPCYRKADNVAGMYDLVSGVFYTNAGTGSFTVGPDVIG